MKITLYRSHDIGEPIIANEKHYLYTTPDIQYALDWVRNELLTFNVDDSKIFKITPENLTDENGLGFPKLFIPIIFNDTSVTIASIMKHTLRIGEIYSRIEHINKLSEIDDESDFQYNIMLQVKTVTGSIRLPGFGKLLNEMYVVPRKWIVEFVKFCINRYRSYSSNSLKDKNPLTPIIEDLQILYPQYGALEDTCSLKHVLIYDQKLADESLVSRKPMKKFIS